MGLLIFGLGQIGLGHTCLGGQTPLAKAPPSRFNDCLFRFALSLARFNESEWFSTFCPTMALFTTIEATSPPVCFICRSDYGHVITFIIHLTRIKLRDWGRVGPLPALAPGDVPPCVLRHTLMSYRTLGFFCHNGSHSCYDYLDYEASA